MGLKIVWQNPLSLVRFNRTVQRIISNELGAVYEVRAPDLTQHFEVIPGEVAQTRISDASSEVWALDSLDLLLGLSLTQSGSAAIPMSQLST
jgi:hypothetical protein